MGQDQPHFKCKSQFLLHLATKFDAVQASFQCQLDGTGILFFSLCAPDLLAQMGRSCVSIGCEQIPGNFSAEGFSAWENHRMESWNGLGWKGL